MKLKKPPGWAAFSGSSTSTLYNQCWRGFQRFGRNRVAGFSRRKDKDFSSEKSLELQDNPRLDATTFFMPPNTRLNFPFFHHQSMANLAIIRRPHIHSSYQTTKWLFGAGIDNSMSTKNRLAICRETAVLQTDRNATQ